MYLNSIKYAIGLSFADKRYVALAVGLALIIFPAYFYVFTNSAVGIFSFGSYYKYFILVSSVAISILLAMVITMNVYAVKVRINSQNKVALSSIIISVLPSSLCCTTILPSILATTAPSLVLYGGAVQGILSTLEVPLIILSAFLLLFSLYLVSKNVTECCKVQK